MKPQFTEQIAETYSNHSQAYASILEPILEPMVEEIPRLAALSGGQIALDLATGTGLIARALARTLDSVVGLDISPGVLKLAYLQSEGKIHLVTGDAHKLPYHDQSFDLVTCGISLSHFLNVSAALREANRVLRSGGHFITSAWGTGGKNQSKSAAVEVRQKFLTDKETTFRGSFSENLWADVERAREALTQAGFVDIQVNTRHLSGEYKSHEEALETALAWPITRYRAAQLTPLDQRKLKEETASVIRQVEDLHWRSKVHYYVASRL